MRAMLRGQPLHRERCDLLNQLRTTLITTARESDSVSRVSEITPQLPIDIEALQALVSAACAERDAAIAERDQALSQIDRLRHLLRQLQRAQFGRRSEKLDPEQLLLALEDIEQAIAGNEAADDRRGGRKGAGRKAPCQSRRASRPSAARGCDDRA